MEHIFNQKRASEAYLCEVRIKIYVETLKEQGISIMDAVQMVMSRFGLTKEEAENRVTEFWN